MRFTPEDNFKSRQIREEVIALDPEYARAYVGIAWTHVFDVFVGSSKSPGKSLEQAEELAHKVIALDPSLPDVYYLFGWIYLIKGQHEKAITECERAVTLIPNGAEAHAILGNILTYAGRPEEAMPFLEKAIRLDPFPPSFYYEYFGLAYRMMGQYEEALTEYKKALHLQPNSLLSNVGLAATYSLLGREEEAHEVARKVLKLNLEFSLERFANKLLFKNQADAEHLLSALRKAGLE